MEVGAADAWGDLVASLAVGCRAPGIASSTTPASNCSRSPRTCRRCSGDQGEQGAGEPIDVDQQPCRDCCPARHHRTRPCRQGPQQRHADGPPDRLRTRLGPGSHRRQDVADRVPRRRRDPDRVSGPAALDRRPVPGARARRRPGEGPREIELGPLLHERAACGLFRSFFGISVSSRRRPPHARPRQTPEHAISHGELQARSPRRLLLKRPYADVGGAGSDRLALQPLPKLHPAVKRSPEVTDLRPGAGRPGGAGPGHGYGARPGRILGRRWQLFCRRVGQLLPERLLVR